MAAGAISIMESPMARITQVDFLFIIFSPIRDVTCVGLLFIIFSASRHFLNIAGIVPSRLNSGRNGIPVCRSDVIVQPGVKSPFLAEFFTSFHSAGTLDLGPIRTGPWSNAILAGQAEHTRRHAPGMYVSV